MHLTLVTLVFNDNQIGNAGAISLSKLRHIKELELGGNGITQDGALALARGMPALTSLDISGNEIGDEAFKALIKKQNLRSLLVGYNKISNKVALEVLRNKEDSFNRELTEIYLDGNEIEERICGEIENHLKKDREIESLIRSLRSLTLKEIEQSTQSIGEDKRDSKLDPATNHLLTGVAIGMLGISLITLLGKRNQLSALLKQFPHTEQEQYQNTLRELISLNPSSVVTPSISSSSSSSSPAFSPALTTKAPAKMTPSATTNTTSSTTTTTFTLGS